MFSVTASYFSHMWCVFVYTFPTCFLCHLCALQHKLQHLHTHTYIHKHYTCIEVFTTVSFCHNFVSHRKLRAHTHTHHFYDIYKFPLNFPRNYHENRLKCVKYSHLVATWTRLRRAYCIFISRATNWSNFCCVGIHCFKFVNQVEIARN